MRENRVYCCGRERLPHDKKESERENDGVDSGNTMRPGTVKNTYAIKSARGTSPMTARQPAGR